ncbi:hypothetical protein BHE74_00006475 [Ensete ventricosum]|nr:hypothetical protein GW17_00040080 [Ensete ventricosum]RWW84892.1 hypothetical protein BHE74_00006475 [Ensete ventricosum]
MVDLIGAKLEALRSRLESRMEDRLRTLFAEFGLGRSLSPTKFQQGESLERPSEKEGQLSNMIQPHMGVDFPRREKEDRKGWISHVERYFRC